MAAYLILKWQQDEWNNQQFEKILKQDVTRIIVYQHDYFYIIYKNNGDKYEFTGIYHNFFINLVKEYNIDKNIIQYKVRKHEDVDCRCIIS